MVTADSKRKREILTLVVVFVLVLGVSALAVYLLAGKPVSNEAARPTTPRAVNETTPPDQPTTATAHETFLDHLFGVPQSEAHIVRGENWGEVVARIPLGAARPAGHGDEEIAVHSGL